MGRECVPGRKSREIGIAPNEKPRTGEIVLPPLAGLTTTRVGFRLPGTHVPGNMIPPLAGLRSLCGDRNAEG